MDFLNVVEQLHAVGVADDAIHLLIAQGFGLLVDGFGFGFGGGNVVVTRFVGIIDALAAAFQFTQGGG